MAAAWVIEAVDILEYSPFCLASCFPTVAPNQFRLALHGRVLRSNVPRVMDLKNVSTMHCLTGDLHSKSAEKGIIITIPFPAHSLPGSACLHAREGILRIRAWLEAFGSHSNSIASHDPCGALSADC